MARGVRLDEVYLLRINAIARCHHFDFPHYFADALRRLAPLEANGPVKTDPQRVSVTPRCRLLLHRIAMRFDRYPDAA